MEDRFSFKELMYWDDWNQKAIFFADKNTGKGITKLESDMNGAMDLKIFSSLHRTGTNACENSPCTHLCVAMPTAPGYRCLCPDGKLTKSVDSLCQCCSSIEMYLCCTCTLS